MKKSGYRATAVILLLAILVTLVVPGRRGGYADGPPSELQEKIEQIKTRHVEMAKAISVLEPYVVRNDDGTFKMTINSPRGLGISKEAFRELTQGMATINSLILQGDLVTDDQLRVQPANKPVHLLTNDTLQAQWPCEGENYINFYWWGFEFGLDHCVTQTIVYLIGAGAALSEVAAVIAGALGSVPWAVALGIAGALIGLGAATIAYFDMFDKGIYVQQTWVFNITFIGPQY